MRGEKRRMGFELDHRVKLIFPQGLSMDCYKPILFFFLFGGPDKLDCFQKLINGLISVAVSNDIVVVFVDLEEEGS